MATLTLYNLPRSSQFYSEVDFSIGHQLLPPISMYIHTQNINMKYTSHNCSSITHLLQKHRFLPLSPGISHFVHFIVLFLNQLLSKLHNLVKLVQGDILLDGSFLHGVTYQGLHIETICCYALPIAYFMLILQCSNNGHRKQYNVQFHHTNFTHRLITHFQAKEVVASVMSHDLQLPSFAVEIYQLKSICSFQFTFFHYIH